MKYMCIKYNVLCSQSKQATTPLLFEEPEQIQVQLQKMGYLPILPLWTTWDYYSQDVQLLVRLIRRKSNAELFRLALTAYQAMRRLAINGRLDDATKNSLKNDTVVCTIPETNHLLFTTPSGAKGARLLYLNAQPTLAFEPSNNRLLVGGRSAFTYAVGNKTSQQVLDAVKDALAKWTRWTNITFTNATAATADLYFKVEREEDTFYSFDGPKGLLYFRLRTDDAGSYSGDIHIDGAKLPATTNPTLSRILQHAIGHAFSLSHTQHRTVMNSAHRLSSDVTQKEGLRLIRQLRYHRQPRTKTLHTNNRTHYLRCNESHAIKSVFGYVHDGVKVLHFIKGGYLFTTYNNQQTIPMRMEVAFKRAYKMMAARRDNIVSVTSISKYRLLLLWTKQGLCHVYNALFYYQRTYTLSNIVRFISMHGYVNIGLKRVFNVDSTTYFVDSDNLMYGYPDDLFPNPIVMTWQIYPTRFSQCLQPFVVEDRLWCLRADGKVTGFRTQSVLPMYVGSQIDRPVYSDVTTTVSATEMPFMGCSVKTLALTPTEPTRLSSSVRHQDASADQLCQRQVPVDLMVWYDASMYIVKDRIIWQVTPTAVTVSKHMSRLLTGTWQHPSKHRFIGSIYGMDNLMYVFTNTSYYVFSNVSLLDGDLPYEMWNLINVTQPLVNVWQNGSSVMILDSDRKMYRIHQSALKVRSKLTPTESSQSSVAHLTPGMLLLSDGRDALFGVYANGTYVYSDRWTVERDTVYSWFACDGLTTTVTKNITLFANRPDTGSQAWLRHRTNDTDCRQIEAAYYLRDTLYLERKATVRVIGPASVDTYTKPHIRGGLSQLSEPIVMGYQRIYDYETVHFVTQTHIWTYDSLTLNVTQPGSPKSLRDIIGPSTTIKTGLYNHFDDELFLMTSNATFVMDTHSQTLKRVIKSSEIWPQYSYLYYDRHKGDLMGIANDYIYTVAKVDNGRHLTSILKTTKHNENVRPRNLRDASCVARDRHGHIRAPVGYNVSLADLKVNCAKEQYTFIFGLEGDLFVMSDKHMWIYNVKSDVLRGALARPYRTVQPMLGVPMTVYNNASDNTLVWLTNTHMYVVDRYAFRTLSGPTPLDSIFQHSRFAHIMYRHDHLHLHPNSNDDIWYIVPTSCLDRRRCRYTRWSSPAKVTRTQRLTYIEHDDSLYLYSDRYYTKQRYRQKQYGPETGGMRDIKQLFNCFTSKEESSRAATPSQTYTSDKCKWWTYDIKAIESVGPLLKIHTVGSNGSVTHTYNATSDRVSSAPDPSLDGFDTANTVFTRSGLKHVVNGTGVYYTNGTMAFDVFPHNGAYYNSSDDTLRLCNASGQWSSCSFSDCKWQTTAGPECAHGPLSLFYNEQDGGLYRFLDDVYQTYDSAFVINTTQAITSNLLGCATAQHVKCVVERTPLTVNNEHDRCNVTDALIMIFQHQHTIYIVKNNHLWLYSTHTKNASGPLSMPESAVTDNALLVYVYANRIYVLYPTTIQTYDMTFTNHTTTNHTFGTLVAAYYNDAAHLLITFNTERIIYYLVLPLSVVSVRYYTRTLPKDVRYFYMEGQIYSYVSRKNNFSRVNTYKLETDSNTTYAGDLVSILLGCSPTGDPVTPTGSLYCSDADTSFDYMYTIGKEFRFVKDGYTYSSYKSTPEDTSNVVPKDSIGSFFRKKRRYYATSTQLLCPSDYTTSVHAWTDLINYRDTRIVSPLATLIIYYPYLDTVAVVLTDATCHFGTFTTTGIAFNIKDVVQLSTLVTEYDGMFYNYDTSTIYVHKNNMLLRAQFPNVGNLTALKLYMTRLTRFVKVDHIAEDILKCPTMTYASDTVYLTNKDAGEPKADVLLGKDLPRGTRYPCFNHIDLIMSHRYIYVISQGQMWTYDPTSRTPISNTPKELSIPQIDNVLLLYYRAASGTVMCVTQTTIVEYDTNFVQLRIALRFHDTMNVTAIAALHLPFRDDLLIQYRNNTVYSWLTYRTGTLVQLEPELSKYLPKQYVQGKLVYLQHLRKPISYTTRSCRVYSVFSRLVVGNLFSLHTWLCNNATANPFAENNNYDYYDDYVYDDGDYRAKDNIYATTDHLCTILDEWIKDLYDIIRMMQIQYRETLTTRSKTIRLKALLRTYKDVIYEALGKVKQLLPNCRDDKVTPQMLAILDRMYNRAVPVVSFQGAITAYRTRILKDMFKVCGTDVPTVNIDLTTLVLPCVQGVTGGNAISTISSGYITNTLSDGYGHEPSAAVTDGDIITSTSDYVMTFNTNYVMTFNTNDTDGETTDSIIQLFLISYFTVFVSAVLWSIYMFHMREN